ncbi:MAG: alkene reductase [Amphiplicatus sp.]
MTDLFDPITIGGLELRNRIFMAPLTRGRASRDHVPTPLMVRYYAQRAGAGLITSEATGICRQGLGWPYAPGIWSREQVEGWKPVTEAVHAAGGRMFLQLWHMGRAIHPDFLGGERPVSASATATPGLAHTYSGRQPYVAARPLRVDEIPLLLDDYRRAARNAIEAGFDGVQIHAGNGYLIDQFLRDRGNLRDDDYGGPIENRVRLLREITEAVVDEVGAARTAVRLSPNGESQGVIDSDPEPLFARAAQVLDAIGVVFLEVRDPGSDSTFRNAEQPRQSPVLRRYYRGALALNSDYDLARAQSDIRAGRADVISFGRAFIANPDLPARLETGAPLNEGDVATWYSQGPEGYVDYPALSGKAGR